MALSVSKTLASFWAFGLLNNVLYSVILSAAADLVDPTTPKALVLLADIVPGFLVKLTAPFYIHLVPYRYRIGLLVILSVSGMILVSAAPSRPVRLFGVAMSSLSGGVGELTFLQLTHFYGVDAINGFSSGTGAAGLVASFVYMVFTIWFHIEPRIVLALFSILPFAFVIVYSRVLPNHEYSSVTEDEEQDIPLDPISLKEAFFSTLNRIKPLILPYTLPLTTVYIGEYTINQGIAPTLLFDPKDMPFKTFRDVYVTYGALYQIGVFISRSSAPWFRVRQLYLPAVLQTINLIICILQSLFMFIPSIYLMFILVFYEGLLGGLAYVNTFMLVSEQVKLSEREFAMGAVGLSDSGGVVIAAAISMWLEPALCGYQVGTGRPWCRER